MHGIIRRVVVPCNQRPKGFNPASIRHLTEVLTAWQHTAVTCCDFFQAFAWHVNVALQGRSSWKVQLFSIRFQVQLQNVTELQGSKIDQLGFIGFTLPNLPNTFACSILFHPVPSLISQAKLGLSSLAAVPRPKSAAVERRSVVQFYRWVALFAWPSVLSSTRLNTADLSPSDLSDLSDLSLCEHMWTLSFFKSHIAVSSWNRMK